MEIEIIDLNLIETICGVSYEGKILTGKKLIVNGFLKQFVEYVALNSEQSVHAAEFNIPFSTFIIVPKNFVLNKTVNIQTYIEDIFYQLLDKRTIFKNTTLFLEVVC